MKVSEFPAAAYKEPLWVSRRHPAKDATSSSALRQLNSHTLNSIPLPHANLLRDCVSRLNASVHSTSTEETKSFALKLTHLVEEGMIRLNRRKVAAPKHLSTLDP